MVEMQTDFDEWKRETPKRDFRDFKIGDELDCWDTAMSRWYPATVIGLRGGEVRIHYKNFASRYDEWIPTHSDGLAEPGTKTTQTQSTNYWSSGTSYGGTYRYNSYSLVLFFYFFFV